MKPEIIKTADGSHSLYVRSLDEHYHSVNGAIQESKHVFINAGLKNTLSLFQESKAENTSLHILEIGLGTGLNALLTYIQLEQLAISVHYTALETNPLTPDLLRELNYVQLLQSDSDIHGFSLKEAYAKIHSSEWEKKVALTSHFTIYKMQEALQKVHLENNYNLIYFDAFGPRVQPELWTEEIFEKLYKAMCPHGCLVTYCAKGEVKRTLKKIGFTVETLEGPPGKREMVRAVKNAPQ